MPTMSSSLWFCLAQAPIPVRRCSPAWVQRATRACPPTASARLAPATHAPAAGGWGRASAADWRSLWRYVHMLPQLQPARDGRRRLSLILYLDYLPSFRSPLCHGRLRLISSATISISCPFKDALDMPEGQRASKVRGNVKRPVNIRSSGEATLLSWGIPSHTIATHSDVLPVTQAISRRVSGVPTQRATSTLGLVHNARRFSAT